MRSIRPLLAFLRPYRLWAILAPLCMMLEVAGDLMQPRLIQTIIDQGIARNDMSVVLHSGAWMIVLAIVGVVTGGGCGVFAVLTAQGLGADLRGALFRHVQLLSFGNLDELETGGLITRLTNDVSQVQELVMIFLRVAVRAPLLMIGGLIMAVVTSPKLALLFLALIPFVIAVLVVVIRRSYPLFGRVQRRLDALNTVLQENLSGVRVVKAFARAAHERTRFGASNDALMNQNTFAVRVSAITMPLLMLALNGGMVAALWLGGVSIRNGDLQVGQLIAFNNYLMQTLVALMMVSMVITQIARAEASARRVREVLETVPVIPGDGGTELTSVQGHIRFENVGFSYGGSEGDAVLKNISFEAQPGQTIAILGATGAGKSSLVQLIPRFYDVTEGRITLDGVDLRSLNESTLRRSISIALQEAVLFSGTIRDNIRYGCPDAGDAEVLSAARAAQADEFITRLPDGYDSVVGQRGVNLSGGQKQRLAIARALLLQPAVLILDDSTSAVDVGTAARIQSALEAQNRRQTRFIVAQRISAAIGADRILVLDDGELVAQGTHHELLESSPVYREIYESQTENGVLHHGSE
jgi:ATP-binding cassette subfamily B multidrug efflux pump